MGKKILPILGSKNVFILAYAFKQKETTLNHRIPNFTLFY